MLKSIIQKSTFSVVLVATTFFFSGCEKELDENGLSADASQNASANSSKTAQSVMVDVSVDDYMLQGEEVWKFDEDEGATYFTNGTLAQRKNAAKQIKCSFFAGGDLVNVKIGNTTFYVDQNKKTVASRTAWDLQSSFTPNSISVPIDIAIAGESVVLNKSNQTKYSFSLQNTDGSSRISNLVVKISNGSREEVISAPSYSFITEEEAGDCLANFNYKGSQTFGTAQDKLKDGTIGSIMALNQWGSKSSCGSAVAKLDQIVKEFGAGEYTITVTGTVKNNEVSIDNQGFKVVTNFVIDAQGCGTQVTQ